MSDRWLTAWALTAIAFGGASLIVPLYVVELGGDAFVLGVLFSTSAFVGVPGALVFGQVADRTGRRRVFVVLAMGVTAVTMVAMPTLESVPLVIAVNAVLWLGFAAATPVLTLLVVADRPESEWGGLIARLNKFQGVGWALGLALGFLVIAGGSRFVTTLAAQRLFFLVCAASASAGLALGVRTLPSDPATAEVPSPGRLRRRLRTATRFNVRGAAFPFTPGRIDVRRLRPRRFADRFTPRLARYFLAVFLAFTGFGVFFAPLPAYLTDVGYSSTGIFALYLALNAAAAGFYGRAALLAARYNLATVQAGGLLARGLALPGIAVAGAVLGGLALAGTVAALFVVIGLAWAVIAVSAATLVTRLSPPAIRGEALGTYGALGAVGGGVGGLLGGWIATAGYAVTFATAGVLVVAGAGIVLWLARQVTDHTAATAGTVVSTSDSGLE